MNGIKKTRNIFYELRDMRKKDALQESSVERTDDIVIKNAPSGTYLNVGRYVGTDNTKMISRKHILSSLPVDVKVIKDAKVKSNDGEPTLFIELSRRLTDEEMNELLIKTYQKAIPQISDGLGAMYGTKDWGDFSPVEFIMSTGESLSDVIKQM